jgi:YihY family inner membrane protein
MSTAQRVPETFELTGDDAQETLLRTGRKTLLRDAFLRLRYSDGFSHARSLAFAVSLGVVQATIALVGFASVLGAGDARRSIVRILHETAPGPAGSLLAGAVQQAGRAGASQQYLGLFLGLVGALVTGATAMGQVERGLNRIYGVEQDRPTVEKYTQALVLAITAGVLAVVAFAALTLDSAIREVTDSSLAADFWTVARWPLAVAAMMASVALLFGRAPRRRQPAWSWLAYGATVAVLLWLAATALLAFFFSISSSFGRTYGPLAGIVALQLWTFLSSVALLFGGSLAAQLEAVRAGQAEPQDAEKVDESEPDQEAPPLVGAATNAGEPGRG